MKKPTLFLGQNHCNEDKMCPTILRLIWSCKIFNKNWLKLTKPRYLHPYRVLIIANFIKTLYSVLTGTFIAINSIIEINISYKISINYCSIKTQIVIILRKILNTASTVISPFSEHITIFRTL